MSKEGNKLIKMYRAATEQKEIAAGYRKGYWLVRESDNQRFYISLYVSEYHLSEVAHKVLSDKTGYDYWIDYSSGLDVNGAVAWTNIDLTDLFL